MIDSMTEPYTVPQESHLQRGASRLADAIRSRGPRLKRILARIACSRPVGRLIGAWYRNVIPTRGLRIDTEHPAITPEMKAAIYWGLYESAEQRFIRRYLRTDLDVIELGASIGLLSCVMAQNGDPSRRVICVEANPQLQETLRRNLWLNVPERDVTVVAKAISYSGTRARFVSGGDNTVGQVDPSAVRGEGGGVLVPTTTLSELLVAEGVDACALVCDIEGMEADLIAHDAAGLARCRQIVIELHDRGDGAATIEQLCSALQNAHGFTLRHRYGPVCVFDRSTASRHL